MRARVLTRDETDRASGRGVGMAVVKATSRSSTAPMSLDTAPGEGTRFLIELPLTPLDHRRADRTQSGDLHLRGAAAPGAGGGRDRSRRPAPARTGTRIAPLRGGSLPIVRSTAVRHRASRRGAVLHVFVVGAGRDGRRRGRRSLSGQREIVVRRMAMN
jgi:hypothetical protein